jgi:phosphoglycerol transferase MdoB-like AlkP superfamily enzyme
MSASFEKIKTELHTRFTSQRFYLLAMASVMIVAAVLMVIFIEYRHRSIADGQMILSLSAFIAKTHLFAYSAAILLAVILVVAGLLGNALMGVAVTFALAVALMLAHTNKFLARNMPLLPEDFQMATEVRALSHMVQPSGLILTFLAIVLLLILAGRISRRWKKHLIHPIRLRTWLVLRLCMLAAGSVFLVAGTAGIRHISGNIVTDPLLDTQFVAWDQSENYDRNGFILGFIYNIQIRKLPVPAQYSKSVIDVIVEKYSALAATANASRLDLSEEDLNVVFIMNESFFDPSRLSAYYPYSGGDVTPNLHRLQTLTSSGWMYSDEYSGNTANVEFEALTGFSNYFLAGNLLMPFTHVVSKNAQFPSIARYFKARGYLTVGMHPFYGSMYKRQIVYGNLGFDHFYDQEGFLYQDTAGHGSYISDDAAYRQLAGQLQASQQKQFITLITMQNHMPYDDLYDTCQFHSEADVNEETVAHIDQYLESLHSSDAALGRLITALDQLEKKVVVVFWGDHLPGLYNLLPEEASSLRQETCLLVYANYLAGEQPEGFGILSSNYITNTVLDFLNAQKPPYHHLLSELQRHYPILSRTYEQGQDAEPSEVLSEYALINYDILSGKRYSAMLGDFFR